MHKIQPTLITIDLDGTLVDSAPDLLAGVNAMQQALGAELRTIEQLRTWVGNGIERLVHRALTARIDQDANPQQFDTGLLAFREAYAQHNGRFSLLYPTVRETLDKLQAAKIKLVCVTNKAEEFTHPLLSKLSIDHYFDAVVCGDTLVQRKPHPAQLLHAASLFHASPDHCLHVGDSVSDIKAARSAQFDIVAVDYGYNHGEPIDQLTGELMPDRIISQFSDLLDTVPG